MSPLSNWYYAVGTTYCWGDTTNGCQPAPAGGAHIAELRSFADGKGVDEGLGLIHPIRSERPPDPPRRGVCGAIKRVPGGARRAEVRRLGPAGASVATAA
jgi:hypothetical protein